MVAVRRVLLTEGEFPAPSRGWEGLYISRGEGRQESGEDVPMRSLTPDQQARLDALMAGLETLPTPVLLAESGRLRCEMPLNEVGKRRMRLALSGAFAAEKIMAYIQALDDVDDHRGKIGRQVFERPREGERLRALESLEAANHLVRAAHLAGRQEVDFHFFAVCVGRLERFLPLAAKATGHKVPQEDRALFVQMDGRMSARNGATTVSLPDTGVSKRKR